MAEGAVHGACEEHDQVVVAGGGAEDLVPALMVHGDSPAHPVRRADA